MSINEFHRLSHIEPKIYTELNDSPYKYFHKWKYDSEINFIEDG